MIELNPENVRFVIQKAREFQTEEGDGADDSAADLDDLEALEREAADEEDLSQDEMTAAIRDLEPDQQICLVALMWLGRGDYDIDDWDSALEDARAAYNARSAEYLIGTPLLADYLEEGLQLHGYDLE
jgi:hypothetical protein